MHRLGHVSRFQILILLTCTWFKNNSFPMLTSLKHKDVLRQRAAQRRSILTFYTYLQFYLACCSISYQARDHSCGNAGRTYGSTLSVNGQDLLDPNDGNGIESGSLF